MNNGTAIGRIDIADGTVFVLRADGSRSELSPGDAIYAGDRIETAADGRVAMAMVDGSRFSLAENGAMTMDEMIFDGNGADGSAQVSVLSGVFVFVSGQIAKMSVDAMIIRTPTMTMGIRGTKLVGSAGEAGDMVTLLREDDGHIGEIVAYNGDSAQVLNQENQTVRVGAYGGEISLPLIVTGALIGDMYGDPPMIGDVGGNIQSLHFNLARSDSETEPQALEHTDDHRTGRDAGHGAAAETRPQALLFDFEPFKLLHDRLFERQFLDSNIYPDHDVDNSKLDAVGKSNALLEDAFIGTRFVSDPGAGTEPDDQPAESDAEMTDSFSDRSIVVQDWPAADELVAGNTPEETGATPLTSLTKTNFDAPLQSSSADAARPEVTASVEIAEAPVLEVPDTGSVSDADPDSELTLADKFGIRPLDRPRNDFSDGFIDHAARPTGQHAAKSLGHVDGHGEGHGSAYGRGDISGHGKKDGTEHGKGPGSAPGHAPDHRADEAADGHGYSVTDSGHAVNPAPDLH